MQLKSELLALNKHREDLKMLETDLNQQKLKMLIKFDKIKFLEDFYNYHTKKEPIHLDADIDNKDLISICEKYYLGHCRKV